MAAYPDELSRRFLVAEDNCRLSSEESRAFFPERVRRAGR